MFIFFRCGTGGCYRGAVRAGAVLSEDAVPAYTRRGRLWRRFTLKEIQLVYTYICTLIHPYRYYYLQYLKLVYNKYKAAYLR